MTTFAALDLIEPLQRAVAAQNYERPTPIQERAIPPLLDGRDVLGCAQTGTGKTAAFALPILQHLASESPQPGRRHIRALVLSPTRELAAQIGDSFDAYAQFLKLRHTVIFGGVNQKPQVATLQRGIDVLVATPGRMLDLMGQGYIDLSNVEFFVLDEADRMLDMGFIHDIRRVLRVLPKQRQNLLFSATMPPEIVGTASSFLHDPIHVEVDPESTTVERIEQQVMFVERNDKRRLLADIIVDYRVDRAIVFTRTKHGANRLVKHLDDAGIRAAAIHGNKSQNARERAMDGFRSGSIPILVATDIASRGIDVDDVSHVFNFDLPNEPETYVHRIGRTGRAGRDGMAISFCDPTEGEYLRAIERLTGEEIPPVTDHDYHCAAAIPAQPRSSGKRRDPSAKRPDPRGPRSPREGSARGNAPRDGQRSDAPRDAQRADASRPADDAAERPARRRRRRRSPAPGAAPAPQERTDRAPRSAAPANPAPRPNDDAPQRRRRRRRGGRGGSGGGGNGSSSGSQS